MTAIEEKAAALLEKCEILSLASISEDGFPRTCVMSKAGCDGMSRIFFTGAGQRRNTVNCLIIPNMRCMRCCLKHGFPGRL